jgi:protein-tyrosine phosphatase
MIEWVIPNILARGCRPGYSGKVIKQATVDAWLADVHALGIRSVICLLAEEQLAFYSSLPTDLISYYRQAGLTVAPVPVCDRIKPPLSDEDLVKVWAAYQKLPKPLLIHCSAGIDRTGMAIRRIQQKLQG